MRTMIEALREQRDKQAKQLDKGFDGFVANDYLLINAKIKQLEESK